MQYDAAPLPDVEKRKLKHLALSHALSGCSHTSWQVTGRTQNGTTIISNVSIGGPTSPYILDQGLVRDLHSTLIPYCPVTSWISWGVYESASFDKLFYSVLFSSVTLLTQALLYLPFIFVQSASYLVTILKRRGEISGTIQLMRRIMLDRGGRHLHFYMAFIHCIRLSSTQFIDIVSFEPGVPPATARDTRTKCPNAIAKMHLQVFMRCCPSVHAHCIYSLFYLLRLP